MHPNGICTCCFIYRSVLANAVSCTKFGMLYSTRTCVMLFLLHTSLNAIATSQRLKSIEPKSLTLILYIDI